MISNAAVQTNATLLYVAYTLQYVVFQRRGTNHLDSTRKRPTSGLLRHILKLCHKRIACEPDKLMHCELLSSEVCVAKLAIISRVMITLELVVKACVAATIAFLFGNRLTAERPRLMWCVKWLILSKFRLMTSSFTSALVSDCIVT